MARKSYCGRTRGTRQAGTRARSCYCCKQNYLHSITRNYKRQCPLGMERSFRNKALLLSRELIAVAPPRFETFRDPRVGFVAYVPVGSIKAGETLAKTGGNGKTIACGMCHGADLRPWPDPRDCREIAELSRAAAVRHAIGCATWSVVRPDEARGGQAHRRRHSVPRRIIDVY